MNDAPSNQDEASAAPDGPKNPWVSWLVWLVLAPMLYVLSVGPVWWLVAKGYLPETVKTFYEPLMDLSGKPELLLLRYMSWWLP